MTKVDEEGAGKCILCERIGQGKKDFICIDCGAPDKLMLVCRCGRRNDLTSLLGGKFSEYLRSVISWNEQDEKDLKPGMTISVGSCVFCGGQKALEKEAGKDLSIYNIRNRGFNVQGGEEGVKVGTLLAVLFLASGVMAGVMAYMSAAGF